MPLAYLNVAYRYVVNAKHQTLHRISLCFVGGYLVALVLIVFWPTPVDRPAAGTLHSLIVWIHSHGVPTFIGYNTIEFTANIVMFVPMGIIATGWTKRAWLGAVLGAAISCLIELGQLIFLADRFASVLDIVANTAGACIGAMTYHLAHTKHVSRKEQVELYGKSHEHCAPF